MSCGAPMLAGSDARCGLDDLGSRAQVRFMRRSREERRARHQAREARRARRQAATDAARLRDQSDKTYRDAGSVLSNPESSDFAAQKAVRAAERADHDAGAAEMALFSARIQKSL